MSFKTINTKEAKQIMEEGKAVVVDVREIEEYQEGHIKAAKLLPLGTLEKEAENHLLDKTTPILVYCRSGKRSAQACALLTRLGYSDVSNFGGITDWPYEVEK